MLIVFILFFFVQIFVVVLFGFVDGDMDGDFGPMDPLWLPLGQFVQPFPVTSPSAAKTCSHQG